MESKKTNNLKESISLLIETTEQYQKILKKRRHDYRIMLLSEITSSPSLFTHSTWFSAVYVFNHLLQNRMTKIEESKIAMLVDMATKTIPYNMTKSYEEDHLNLFDNQNFILFRTRYNGYAGIIDDHIIINDDKNCFVGEFMTKKTDIKNVIKYLNCCNESDDLFALEWIDNFTKKIKYSSFIGKNSIEKEQSMLVALVNLFTNKNYQLQPMQSVEDFEIAFNSLKKQVETPNTKVKEIKLDKQLKNRDTEIM